MTANVENMFSVVQPPWHDLGIVLDRQPDSLEEAIKFAGLDWQVQLQPLYRFPTGWIKGENPRLVDGHGAVVRMDTGDVLGVVGNDYKPLQNHEAFKVFNPLLEQNLITLETAGCLAKGKRVWILAKITTQALEGEDNISWYVLMANGHDGKFSLRFGFTPVRVVCQNTLALACKQSDSKLIRILHRGNVKGTLDAVAKVMDVASLTFDTTLNQYRQLIKKGCNKDDLYKYTKMVLYPKQVNDKSEVGKRIFEKSVLPRFEAEEIETARNTMWGAYNSVSGFLTHDRGKDRETRLDQQWYGISAAQNKRALEIALQR